MMQNHKACLYSRANLTPANRFALLKVLDFRSCMNAGVFLALMLLFQVVKAQVSPAKPVDGSILNLGIGLGMNLPAGDLKDRYGQNMNFTLSGDFITRKNWVLNGGLIYLFGDQVKEDVLAPFRTSTGVILGDDNQIADIFLRQRGFYMGLGGGRLFQFRESARSGLMITLHGGILQHNIRFTDERNSVAQVRAGRHIGYDRLTRGFCLKQTASYKHLSADRLLNFEVALDCMQGFTSEVRAYNFDTGLPTLSSRLDILLGLRVIWNLPFYRGQESVIYY
jgi:hypothetical protein